MIFLNPFLLAGLAAAAIPVLIHLINRRRPRELPFSSLALLKDLQATTMQRVKLKERLLLLLRVLALACLALGFARPILEGPLARIGEAPVSFALVVDNSLSMLRRGQGGTLLDEAKTRASSVAESMRPGDEVFLVPTGLAPGARPEPLRTRDALLDALAGLDAQAGAVPLTRTLDRAAALLESARHPARTLVAITDAQAATITDSSTTRVPFGGRTVLVRVGGDAPPNAAVVGARVLTPIVEAGGPVEVEVTVAAFGGEARRVGVSLREGVRRVAEASVIVRPGARAAVRMRFTPVARGWLGVTAEVDADAFPADDARALIVRVPDLRRILLVRGPSGRYVDAVLAPGLVAGRAPFDVDEAGAASLARVELGDYDAIVLAGAPIPTDAAAALARYVRGGGGLFLFAPASPDAGTAALVGALGGTLGAPLAAPAGLAVAGIDGAHPVFQGVFQTAPGEPLLPERGAVRRYAPLRGGVPLVTLSNGAAFAAELRAGAGAAIVVAAPPDADASDLPTSGLFVPLVLRGALYLTGRAGGAEASAPAGGTLRIRGTYPAPLVLDGPEGSRASARHTPSQRDVPGATLVDAEVDRPGLYAVRAGDSLVARAAITVDARESDLSALSAREAGGKITAATGLRVRVANGVGVGEIRAGEGEQALPQGREVWNVLFGVALGLLVLESFISRRWRPESGA